jgi:hypothetical protein
MSPAAVLAELVDWKCNEAAATFIHEMVTGAHPPMSDEAAQQNPPSLVAHFDQHHAFDRSLVLEMIELCVRLFWIRWNQRLIGIRDEDYEDRLQFFRRPIDDLYEELVKLNGHDQECDIRGEVHEPYHEFLSMLTIVADNGAWDDIDGGKWEIPVEDESE